MKLKHVLPPAVMGALATGLLLIALTAYAIVSYQSQMPQDEAGGVILLVLAALAFTAGGFVAAYLSGRKAKDLADRALSSSALSGALAAVGVSSLSIIGALMGDGSITLAMVEAVLTAVALGVTGITLGTLGGFVFSLISGSGESVVMASLKRGWRAYRKAPASIVPVLVLTLLLFGLGSVSEGVSLGSEELDTVLVVAVGVIGIFLTALAITSVVLTVQRKRVVSVLAKQSTKKGKSVFIGLVAVAVPPVLGGVALLLLLAWAPELADTVAMLFPLLMAGVIAYVLALSMVPQSILIGKKKVRDSFRDSYRLVRSKGALFVGLGGAVLLLGGVVELAMLVVDFAAFTWGMDSSWATSWLSSSANLVVMAAALTGFYLEVKK